MATLFDTLKTRLQGPAAGEGTEAAQRLAQAKTGRASEAGAVTAPRLDVTQERAAVREAQAPQQQLQTQAQAQAIQQQGAAEQQNQVLLQQTRDLQEHKLQIQDNFVQSAFNVVDRFTKENRQLDFNRDRAQAEQLAFQIRFSSDAYIHKLQIEGAKLRLQEEIVFEEALNEAMMKEYMEMFEGELDFKQLMRADTREFNRQMKELEIDFWKETTRLEANSANARAKYEAYGNLATGVISSASNIYSATSNIDWGNGTTTGSPGTGVPLQSAANAEPSSPLESATSVQEDWGLDTSTYKGPVR